MKTKEHGIRVDADRLKALMSLRDLSEAKLAQKMGMHPNSIQYIKSSGRTSFEAMEKLCAALECHPFDLIVAEGYPEPFSVAPVSH